MRKKQLHIISTGKQIAKELIKRVAKIHHHIDYLHLREREWTAKKTISVIKQLVDLGVPKAKIIINDRIDVAAVTDVGGVQLTSHSIDVIDAKHYYPQLQLGCSVHDVREAIEKEKAGAHFLLYGHIFPTRSKTGLPPRGLEKLREVTESVNIPVIAIGGIMPEHIESVTRTGVKGIAVLSGVLLTDDVEDAVKQYTKVLFREASNEFTN